MASDLESALRQLAKNGELTYLSLIPVAGKGEYGCAFCAQVSPASRFGHSEGRDADPVKALLTAIEGLPKSVSKEKPPRKTREFGGKPDEPWDILS